VRSAFLLLSDVPDVLRSGVALTQGGGRQLLFTASDRDNARAVDWCEVDAFEDVPLNNAVRTGRMVVGSLRELTQRYPEFVGRQSPDVHALGSVPLSATGKVLGGFVLFYGTVQAFDRAQLEALHALGVKLSEELHRVRPDGTDLTRSLRLEPVPPGAHAAVYVVLADPAGVGPAREFVRSTLAAWGVADESVDTAVLCASELVTNAVIHSVAGCEVRLLLHRGVLTVTVRDGGDLVGRPRHFSGETLAVQGRGLQIVNALCARWGSEVGPVGTTVWCELRV